LGESEGKRRRKKRLEKKLREKKGIRGAKCFGYNGSPTRLSSAREIEPHF